MLQHRRKKEHGSCFRPDRGPNQQAGARKSTRKYFDQGLERRRDLLGSRASVKCHVPTVRPTLAHARRLFPAWAAVSHIAHIDVAGGKVLEHPAFMHNCRAC